MGFSPLLQYSLGLDSPLQIMRAPAFHCVLQALLIIVEIMGKRGASGTKHFGAASSGYAAFKLTSSWVIACSRRLWPPEIPLLGYLLGCLLPVCLLMLMDAFEHTLQLGNLPRCVLFVLLSADRYWITTRSCRFQSHYLDVHMHGALRF